MTALANFFFASLLAGGMAPILISASPTLAIQANNQQASSPQAATQDQQQSPSKQPPLDPIQTPQVNITSAMESQFPNSSILWNQNFQKTCGKRKFPEAVLWVSPSMPMATQETCTFSARSPALKTKNCATLPSSYKTAASQPGCSIDSNPLNFKANPCRSS